MVMASILAVVAVPRSRGRECRHADASHAANASWTSPRRLAALRRRLRRSTPTAACVAQRPRAAAPTARGWIVPGIANLHSHAFQRAMAGLAERQTNPEDSFWTWRETMYRFAARFDPDTLHAVAAQLYVGNARSRLHHRLRIPLPAPRARRPAVCRSGGDVARADRRRARNRHPPDAAAGAVHDAAASTAARCRERQRRFGHDVDDLPAPARHAARGRATTRLRVGCALAQPARGAGRGDARGARRAAGAIRRCTSTSPNRSAKCRTASRMRGARPVEWLLANADVDARWTLVHATHLDRRGSAGHRRAAARRSRSARPPKPTSAMACSRCARTSMPAARGASARIRTSRCRRSRNCAGSNTASAWSRAIATSPCAPATSSVGEILLHGVLADAARLHGPRRSACFDNGQSPTGSCSTRDAPQFAGAPRTMRSTAGSSAATGPRPRCARRRPQARARRPARGPRRPPEGLQGGHAHAARLTLHTRRGRLAP